MKLVLIEGPGKKEAIQKYLGKDYTVFATKGHIRDLPVNKLGVVRSSPIDSLLKGLPRKVKV